MTGYELKKRFAVECFDQEDETVNDFEILVTLVKLPTGAIETIINTTNLESKINYLYEAYDSDFKLRNNTNVSIVGYTLY